MSNLKKVLSVGLASTMVMGMVATSAAAATYDKFSDKEDIVNKEAVSMVSELGIIAGLTDGSYAPKQNIDRASFARLVCVALNGGKEPQLGNLKTTFTDTQGNWAEKYIAYCVQQGIIAGKGNNTFAPSANVTGSEAAKMLLVALGYNTTYEKIGGATWQTTTDVLANQAGLYDGLDAMNTSDPLTRDNAAQMIYNTLNATKVKYEMIPGISANGQVTMTTQRVNVTKTEDGTTVDVTLLSDAFGVVTVEGVVVANEFADLRGTGSDDEGESVISVTNHGDGQNNYSNTAQPFKVSTGEELLGKAVTLYVKPASTASNSSSRATVIGAPVTTDDNTVVTDLSKDSIATVANDNDLILNASTKYAFNYAASTKSAVDALVGQGVEKTLIDHDDDGIADYVLVNRFDLGKVTKYSTKDDGAMVVKTDRSTEEYEKADVVGFDDVKKDDFVLTAEIGGKLYVEKPETVTGTLELYKTSGSLTTKLTVSGTEYKVSNVAKVHSDLTNAAGYGATQLDTEATFYLDRNGYIVAAGDVEEAAYSYAYVIAKDASGANGIDNDRVKVALSDGTTGIYEFTKNTGANGVTTIGNVTVGDVYRYTITSDKKIKLTNDATPTAASSTGSFEKGKAAVTLDSDKIYATNNTLFFYTDGLHEDVDVYTGFNKAPSTDVTVSGSTKTMEVWKNGSRVVAVTVVGGTTSVSSNDHLYIYSVGGGNNDYTVASAVLGGQTDVVENAKFSTDGLTPASGNLYRYTVNSDNEYVLSAADKSASSTYFASGVVTEKYEGSFVVSGGVNGAEYGLNNETIVVDDVDDPSTPTVETKGGFSKGDYVNVIFDSNTNDALMVVIVANDNNIYTVESGVTLSTGEVKVDGEDVAVTSNKFTAYAGSEVVITSSNISNSTEYYVGEGNYVTSDASGNTVKFTMPNYGFKFDEAFSVTLDGGSAVWFVKGDNVTASDLGLSGVEKVWDGSTAKATTGALVSSIAADTTLTSMYKVTVAGLGSSDVLAGDTSSVSIAADGSDYMIAGETVNVTNTTNEIKATGTVGVTVTDGASSFVMPSNDVTVTFGTK